MAVSLTDFKVANRKSKNGGAITLATFGVNLGAITIKGYELVKLTSSGKVFVAVPGNRFQNEAKEWKTYRHIHYNGDRGSALETEIQKLAADEYKRRASAVNQAPARTGGSRYDQGDDFGGGSFSDDDLPF